MDYILYLINKIISSTTNFDLIIIKSVFFILLFIYITFIIVHYIRKLLFKRAPSIETISTYRKTFSFNNYYHYATPPSDLPPALVNLLISNDFINPHMITNSLMYLIKNRFYTIKEVSINSTLDLDFIYTNYTNQLKERHLRYLIDWFSSYTNTKDFSLNDIYKIQLTKEGSKDFIRRYHTWIDLIKKDAIELEFYYEIMGKTILSNNWTNERNKWISYSNYIKDYFDEENRPSTVNETNSILLYSSSMLLSLNPVKDFNKRLINACINNVHCLTLSINDKSFSYYSLVDDKISKMFINISIFESTNIYSNNGTGTFKSRISDKELTTSIGNKTF